MSARKTKAPGGSGPPLVDIYLPWAQLTAFRDAGGKPVDGGRWLWLLIELHPDDTASAFQQAAKQHTQHIRVPAHYANPPTRLESTRFCTAIVSASMLEALHEAGAASELQALWARIKRFEIGYTTQPWAVDAAGDVPAQPASARARKGPTDVVGVIDDGLAFANTRFCYIDKNSARHTRFLSLWDQNPSSGSAGPWGCGRHYGSNELDAHIAASSVGTQVDEDAVYAHAAYREVANRVTHGTHVLDLACGCEPGESAEAPHIVGVQIPPHALEDTSCASITVFMLDAVRYVLAEAHRACPTLPVLINLSMGNIAGPHDGSSIFECALDELIAARKDREAPLTIVMPAGNSLLSRCHAWAAFDAGKATQMSLDWLIHPGDGTPNFVELWFSEPTAGDADGSKVGAPVSIDGVSVTVTPPGGAAGITLTPGKELPLELSTAHGRHAVGLFSLRREGSANGDCAMALLAVAPTICGTDWPLPAPAGTWRITVASAGTNALECNAYVQRDDIAFGRRGQARQSILLDPDYELFDPRGALQLVDTVASFVRRVGTFNGLATGKLVQVVGGARHLRSGAFDAARYSSVELPTVFDPHKVHLTAVTEDSGVLHGVLAAGTRSGSQLALSGTSMAAPQHVRDLWQTATRSGPKKTRATDNGAMLRPVVPPATALAARSARRRGSP